jgi:hypothetical protein
MEHDERSRSRRRIAKSNSWENRVYFLIHQNASERTHDEHDRACIASSWDIDGCITSGARGIRGLSIGGCSAKQSAADRRAEQRAVAGGRRHTTVIEARR